MVLRFLNSNFLNAVHNTIYEYIVLSFELWFLIFRFNFLVICYIITDFSYLKNTNYKLTTYINNND
jgi:hypothetical protein